ncbi:MAG: 30S ribosomal protein S15 [ANME-2 cluster archaeon]|nr:30S ribosomal protein S15 [ANME-2 cluster archaeon]
MARMHTRKRGQSRSTKPLRKEVPAWVTLSSDEIEKKVVELSKLDNSTSKIGIIMRDMYGVPDISLSTGNKVSKILGENNIGPELPEDFTNLVTKALRLRKHLAVNHKDQHNKRALNITEAKVRRLGKYYLRSGALPKGWKYDPKTAERLITQ